MIDGYYHFSADVGTVSALGAARSGWVHAAVIDFLLDWLEAADEATFGTVAAALVRLARDPLIPKVFDIERKFPESAGRSTAHQASGRVDNRGVRAPA